MFLHLLLVLMLHLLFRDLGHFHYFLSLEIMQAENSVHLNQHKYVHDLLQSTSMFESKYASTPGMVGQNLSKHDGGHFHDVTLYQSIVGVIQYLTLIRPDISFVVNKECQFMSSPSNTHWLAVKCILRYLNLWSFHVTIFRVGHSSIH